MKCEQCGTNEAVMHVTQVVQNESRVLNLCDSCARDLGFAGPAVPANFPLGDFLAQLGGGESQGSSAPPADACAFCGLTFAEFRESGRLGCPHCYSAFEDHLRGLLRRIHGGTQHTGKVYLPPDPSQTEKEKRLDGLRRRLERAVDAEDFERAAHLRDQIRGLETSGRGGTS
jgi:protein arginine kinase activator